MRIIHVLNHIQEIGNGIVNVAVDLACRQAEFGHDVAVVSSGGEYEKLLHQYGVKHYELNQARTPVNLIRASWKFAQIISDFAPEIVHVHMMTGVILAYTMRSFKHYGLVATVHNEFQRSSVLMGLADITIAVSDAVASSMIRRGISADQLRVVRNGVLESPRTQPCAELTPLPLAKPAIVTVSGLYKRKGIGEVIDAFTKIAAAYSEAQLYIVGDGPDRNLFEAQAKASPFSQRIHFEGFQPQPQRYLLGSDIFVLASHYESFGLAIAEAREAGCAIIATDVDGISQTLDGGKAGMLVPSQNSHALANAIALLLDNPELLASWKLRASQNTEWLSVKRVSRETLAVYRELLKTPVTLLEDGEQQVNLNILKVEDKNVKDKVA